ncbi:uracil-DNA glycosylase [Sphingomonas swuensis]
MNPDVDGSALSRAEAASLLAWWLDAGVDVGIAEDSRNWLEKKTLVPLAGDAAFDADELRAPRQTPAPDQANTPPLPRAGGETRPTTLDDYHAWLAETADLPLFRAGASRALPHGSAEAEVMLLSGIPSPEDVGEGKPIGGQAYALTVRMLAAIGLGAEQAYVAALTCFSSAGARLPETEVEACREGLLHQIGLARPKRLLLLGDAPARLLLGKPLLQARGKVHRIAGVPTVATFHPRHLLERTADKALAWRDLLALMGDHP